MFCMAKEWSFRSQGIPKTNYNENRYRSYAFFKSFTWSRRCFLPLKDSELSKRWKGKFALPPFRLHSLLEIHIHSFYDAKLPGCIQTRFHETWLVCCRGLAPLNTSSYLCTLIGLLREKIGAVSLHPSLNFLVANYVPRLSFSLRLAWKGDPYSET